MGSPGVQTIAVEKYMRERPGELLHYRDVAEGVGATHTQVSNVLVRMVRAHPERGIRREQQGRYVYRPDADHPARGPAVPDGPKPGDLFECVGSLGDGMTVVRDPVSYVLYRLEPA